MAKNYELEYLKLENEKLKQQLKNKNDFDQNDIILLVNLASDMRELLIECRNQQININLAKKIDYVLSRAKDLD